MSLDLYARPISVEETTDVTYDAVIVVLDGSKTAAEALPRALAIALDNDAPLVLLYALAPRRAPPPADAGSYTSSGGREHDLRRSQAEGYLQGIRRSLEERGPRIEVRVDEGTAAAVVDNLAGSWSRPLVVMAAGHGVPAAATQRASGDGEGSECVQPSLPVLIVEPRLKPGP
jgi:nucleotide-binding universal stress UspA family protein